MAKFKDRTGERYGRLLVLEHYGKDRRGKHLWKCVCDCGNEKIVVGDNLSSGKSNSCGCLKKSFYPKRGISLDYTLIEDWLYIGFSIRT